MHFLPRIYTCQLTLIAGLRSNKRVLECNQYIIYSVLRIVFRASRNTIVFLAMTHLLLPMVTISTGDAVGRLSTEEPFLRALE
jgi:hypothetical protein